MKKLVFLSSLLLTVASVHAQSFSGFTIGGVAGFGSNALWQKDNAGNKAPNGLDAKISGGLLGLQMGTGGMITSRLYLGLTLAYLFSTAKKTYSGSLKELIPDAGNAVTGELSLKAKTRFEALIKLGLVVYERWMPYVEVGYVYSRHCLSGNLKYDGSLGGVDPFKASTQVNLKGSGFAYGAGVDFKPLKHMVVSLGYRGALSLHSAKMENSKVSGVPAAQIRAVESYLNQSFLGGGKDKMPLVDHSVRLVVSYAI